MLEYGASRQRARSPARADICDLSHRRTAIAGFVAGNGEVSSALALETRVHSRDIESLRVRIQENSVAEASAATALCSNRTKPPVGRSSGGETEFPAAYSASWIWSKGALMPLDTIL